ncbi:MAG: heavy metal-binding domain-containing protein [Acidimicrobiia bacterium]|nr:heavy metal-binding domain-containing protein [Acidimicrobiia bacterium]
MSSSEALLVQRDHDADSEQGNSPWEEEQDATRRRYGSRARAPRTRLNQALTVASGASSASVDPWGDGAQQPPVRSDVEPVSYRDERTEPETPADSFGPTRDSSTKTVDTGDPVHLVVDLRPKALPASTTGDAKSNYGLGTTWGANWGESAQGWVPDEYGTAVWRPVVATTEDLAVWDVRTYLGIVTAEVAVEAHGGDFKQLGTTLTRAREMGVEGLVEEAIARGAHAVVGVDMTYTAIGGRLLITVTGTAVTLKEKGA